LRIIFFIFMCCQILLKEHGTNCNFRTFIFNRISNRTIWYAFQWFWYAQKRFNSFWKFSHYANRGWKPRSSGRTLQFAIWSFFKNAIRKRNRFLKILNTSHYPSLRNFDLRIFSMFGSTYLCKRSFSKTKLIKNDKRSFLSDASLSSLMQTNSSKIFIDIPSLETSKHCKRFRTSNWLFYVFFFPRSLLYNIFVI